MGPEATILLMQKVLAAVPAQDDADHVPLIVYQNPQVPSRIKALIDGTGEDPGPILAKMAKALEHAGAQALAMPCNTAHHYVRAVTTASRLPFLHMLELTATRLAEAGAQRVGMLASPATRLTGVFDQIFTTHGLTPVWLEPDEALLALIQTVKASGPGGQETAMRQQAEALMDAGAEHLLIACTELSLLTDAMPDDVPWTDSLDCLVTAIVAAAKAP